MTRKPAPPTRGRALYTIERFLKGDEGTVGDLATRISGSPDLYEHRGVRASINFVTCHDGFTLIDLFSYNDKHNEANGENNNDGANDNNSWNCDAEGYTDNPEINRLRIQQAKNAFLLLLTSRGIPMLLSGDEVAKTQRGNNNAYCQDNEMSWFDWSLADTNAELLDFVSKVIAFRRAHPVLRGMHHPSSVDPTGSGHPEVSWHGVRPWQPDWSSSGRLLALMWCGHHVEGCGPDYVYAAANAHWEDHELELPIVDDGWTWHLFADTKDAPGAFAPGAEVPLSDPRRYSISPRSVVTLVARPVARTQ